MMTTKLWILIGSLAAGLGGGAGLQTSRSPGGQPLSRIFSTTPEQSQAAPQSAEAWRERMRASDLAQREQDFDQMLAAARRDGALRKAIESWAADARDLDLAWTARLALRDLDASPFDWLGGRGFPRDPLANGFDLDFGAGADPQALFDQMRQRLGPGWPAQPGGGQGTQPGSSAESFSLEVGPNGVKCHVKCNVDGKEEVQDYEADSMDQLLEAHPQLRGKLGDGRFSFSFGRGDDWTNAFPRLRNRLGGGLGGDANVRTDMLGVVAQPLTADDAKGLGLDAGEGLRIERVEPGTIASSMGLQRGQVLVELNHTPIKTRDDISAEIKKRGADAAMEAVVVDRWGQRRTHTWKPDTTKQL